MHGNYEESLYRQQVEARGLRGARSGVRDFYAEPAIRPVDDVQRPMRDELRFEKQDGSTWSGAAIIASLP